MQQQSVVELWCGLTWKRNSVAGSGGPTVPACRLGGGCVKNDAAHLHMHYASLLQLNHLIAVHETCTLYPYRQVGCTLQQQYLHAWVLASTSASACPK